MLANTPMELFTYVKSVTIPEITNEIENISEAELSIALLDTVYSNNGNSHYDNTYTLLTSIKSIPIKIASPLGIEVKIETLISKNMMSYNYHSYKDLDGNFKYENGNEDNRSFIVNWLNDGHGGVFNYVGKHFMELAQKRINKTAKSKVSIYLKSIGYKLSK